MCRMIANWLQLLQKSFYIRHRIYARFLFCFVRNNSHIACRSFFRFVSSFCGIFVERFLRSFGEKFCACWSSVVLSVREVWAFKKRTLPVQAWKTKFVVWNQLRPLRRRHLVEHRTPPQGVFFFRGITANGWIFALDSHWWRLIWVGLRKFFVPVLVLVILADGGSLRFSVFLTSFILLCASTLSLNHSLNASNVGRSQFFFTVCMNRAFFNFGGRFCVAWHWIDLDGSAMVKLLQPRHRLSLNIWSDCHGYAFSMAGGCWVCPNKHSLMPVAGWSPVLMSSERPCIFFRRQQSVDANVTMWVEFLGNQSANEVWTETQQQIKGGVYEGEEVAVFVWAFLARSAFSDSGGKINFSPNDKIDVF